jgi:hypothetical protein
LRRNCLLRQVIERKIKEGIEMTGRREENVGSYWMTLMKGYSHLKEEALYRTMWRAHIGKGFGPAVRLLNE